MDIIALKTFLEVSKTKHFGAAAEALYISQSAVSARIKSLEEILGVELFIRERGNIQLTSAGVALVPHAKSILKLWSRAQQEVSVDSGNRDTLAVGGLPGLWDITLQEWIYALSNSHPHLFISADIFGPNTLYNSVLNGTLDVAFLYDAPQSVNIITTPLQPISLCLVSSMECKSLPLDWSKDYIQVDWGMSFSVEFATHFPGVAGAKMSTGVARIAQEVLMRSDGFAYLAEPAVRHLIASGDLFLVPNTPVFKRHAFAIHHQENNKIDLIHEVIELL